MALHLDVAPEPGLLVGRPEPGRDPPIPEPGPRIGVCFWIRVKNSVNKYKRFSSRFRINIMSSDSK